MESIQTSQKITQLPLFAKALVDAIPAGRPVGRSAPWRYFTEWLNLTVNVFSTVQPPRIFQRAMEWRRRQIPVPLLA